MFSFAPPEGRQINKITWTELDIFVIYDDTSGVFLLSEDGLKLFIPLEDSKYISKNEFLCM